MSCTLRWADPPCKTVSDSRSSIAWSMSSLWAHLKWLLELGQVFRQGVPSDELTPPIWNCHWQQMKYWLIYVCNESPFKTVIFITALHCVKLYILSCGVELLERLSHEIITYENEAIYVNFKFLLSYDFMLLLLSVHNYTWTTTSRTTTTKRMRIKRFM